METNALLERLNRTVPGSVLQLKGFGRSLLPSVWIEMRSLPKIAEFLKDEPKVQLDWLENLTAMELDGMFVLTYFLRSSKLKGSRLILRGSVVSPGAPESTVSLPSVAGTWKTAQAFEVEIQDLFGIRFSGPPGFSDEKYSSCLPKDWVGYPLRKGYRFPAEVKGIVHSRKIERQQ